MFAVIAMRRKYEHVAECTGIGPGRRILDLGCRWGPLLGSFVSAAAGGWGEALLPAGEVLPPPHDLGAHLVDAREIDHDALGRFSAVASLGTFEHLCSPDDYRAGREDHIHRDVFARVASLLLAGGHLYLRRRPTGAVDRFR
jgi:cyclopropane-fatty-acyl-phospholipid synthase